MGQEAMSERDANETGLHRVIPRATNIDRTIASRIHAARLNSGLSQGDLASVIGITYQQAHKYERGLNRVSAGRLWEISRALNVPVESFFAGCGEGYPAPVEPPHARALLHLCRDFASIDNEQARILLCSVARLFAECSNVPVDKLQNSDLSGDNIEECG